MVYIKEFSIISEEGENFTGCDRCIHSEDGEEVCIARLCVHAIHELNDCYKERKQERKSDGKVVEVFSAQKRFCGLSPSTQRS